MSINHFAQSVFLVISSLINIFRILATAKVKLVYNFLAPPQAFLKRVMFVLQCPSVAASFSESY